ncbi:hypothetical protein [Bacillus sp. EB01]|uniref:hypothetical protein n=1 Tax=Bacillus sp. EB01 TaxID=1347086 RepID=UPI0005C50FF8|nr:hypothetical protein [Bacillus sp. EB01]
MKKALSILMFLLVPLLIVGCSQKEIMFNHTELKEELKKEGISPKLPTSFPMTIVEYERVIPPHETNINEVIFKGEEGMRLSLTIEPPQVEYHNLQYQEDVTINGNDGFFIEGPGPSIHWTDGDYHYILTYFTDEKVTKEMMVAVAESFQ